MFQIWLGGFFSPSSQFKARDSLKNSNIDFFTSLIKEGKFINAVDGLTIFIKSKNDDNSYNNIFIDDSTKNKSKMIYAKNGIIIDNKQKKSFQLFNGKVINKEKKKINIFEFDQIDFNLADLLGCLFVFNDFYTLNFNQNFKCEKKISKEIYQELFKRFYKPLYIPLIALICCFLIIFPKSNFMYNKNKKIIFLITFFVLVLSEASLRYSSMSKISTIIYLIIPWLSFIFIYFIFYKRTKNV